MLPLTLLKERDVRGKETITHPKTRVRLASARTIRPRIASLKEGQRKAKHLGRKREIRRIRRLRQLPSRKIARTTSHSPALATVRLLLPLLPASSDSTRLSSTAERLHTSAWISQCSTLTRLLPTKR